MILSALLLALQLAQPVHPITGQHILIFRKADPQ